MGFVGLVGLVGLHFLEGGEVELMEGQVHGTI